MRVEKQENAEFVAAICDDDPVIREQIRTIAGEKLMQEDFPCQILEFTSAEAVLQYTSHHENKRIELLYLDIEMQGMSGLQLMQQLIVSDFVWRIVFVTSHTENILSSFSIKTVGFIVKPLAKEEVGGKLHSVLREWKQNQNVTCKSMDGRHLFFNRESILYFEAARNYCRIYYIDGTTREIKTVLLDERLGELENSLGKKEFLRIHKSFLIHMMYLDSIHEKVKMYHGQVTLPIGRRYREEAKHGFLEYIANKVRERI